MTCLSPSSLYRDFQHHIAFQRAALGLLCDGSGTLISDHGIRVFLVLADTFAQCNTPARAPTTAMLTAALYHDVLEDTQVTPQQLKAQSSDEVVSLVQELTIIFDGRPISEVVNPLREVSEQAVLIKLADIVDNAEKSRFVLRSNAPDFYDSFFLPLLAEYEQIFSDRAKRIHGFPAEFKALHDRMQQAIGSLREQVAFFSPIL